MHTYSSNALTSIVLVTVVFGFFILAASIRIRNSWKMLHSNNTSKPWRILRKVDLVFSGIFLAASIAFYMIFILNIGR
jgi:hypothetical protein